MLLIRNRLRFQSQRDRSTLARRQTCTGRQHSRNLNSSFGIAAGAHAKSDRASGPQTAWLVLRLSPSNPKRAHRSRLLQRVKGWGSGSFSRGLTWVVWLARLKLVGTSGLRVLRDHLFFALRLSRKVASKVLGSMAWRRAQNATT